MKKYKISLLTLFFVAITVTSCNNDDATNDSVIVVNDGIAEVTPVSQYITINGVNAVNENGVNSTIEYAVTLQNAQPVDTYVTVALVSGTATEDVDFEFDHQILIKAFQTSAIGKVKIIGDAEVEDTETFVLKVGSEFDANIKISKELAFEITDFGDLNLSFDWDRDIPGFPFTLCEVGYDVDVYILDEEGNNVIGFDAATFACTETTVLSLLNNDGDGLPEGEYTVIFNVYDDATLSTVGITPAFDIPLTITYSRDNSTFAGSLVQDASDAIDSDFGSTPNYDTINIYVATITVENGLFKLSKNGALIATGRTASLHLNNRADKTRNSNRKNFFN